MQAAATIAWASGRHRRPWRGLGRTMVPQLPLLRVQQGGCLLNSVKDLVDANTCENVSDIF